MEGKFDSSGYYSIVLLEVIAEEMEDMTLTSVVAMGALIKNSRETMSLVVQENQHKAGLGLNESKTNHIKENSANHQRQKEEK